MEKLDWRAMLSVSSPWKRLVSCPERELDQFARRNSNNVERISVRIIRGQRCIDHDRLFQEWAAALQFPYYFGHNWDAFDECLADLEWLNSDGIVLLVSNSDRLLQDETGISTFFDILEKVAAEWDDTRSRSSDRPEAGFIFRAIFQYSPDNGGDLRDRPGWSDFLPIP